MNDLPPSLPAQEPQQPPQVPQPPAQSDFQIGAIIRDVLIIFVLTALGGFIVGVAMAGPTRDQQKFLHAIALSNISLGAVGFAISGCLAPGKRWAHLGYVAIGVWLG